MVYLTTVENNKAAVKQMKETIKKLTKNTIRTTNIVRVTQGEYKGRIGIVDIILENGDVFVRFLTKIRCGFLWLKTKEVHIQRDWDFVPIQYLRKIK